MTGALVIDSCSSLAQVPDLLRKKVRCGFGLWPDYYGKLDPENPENSYFSPGRFQRALYWALQLSDGYVWLYGQSWSWWLAGPDERAPVDQYDGKRGLPLAYWKSLEHGRSSPGKDTSPVRVVHTTGLPTQGRNYCIDGSNLPKLLENAEKVYELPVEGWTFKLDERGTARDDPATFDRSIAIGSSWRDQGMAEADPIGWYRLQFTLPQVLKGRKLHFYFPDVDGSAWVTSMSCPRPQRMAWRHVGFDKSALRQPFVLTHPGLTWFFEPGEPAVVVIKVMRHGPTGGIMAPIQVLAKR